MSDMLVAYDELYEWYENSDTTFQYYGIAKYFPTSVNPPILPWSMREFAFYTDSVSRDQSFAQSYPSLSPYYPMGGFHGEIWADPWMMQAYHSYWWG